MGKLLRVLVIVLLLLSAAALVLGLKLFNTRETLKGSAQTLVDGTFRLAGTIEAEQAADLTAKEQPKMDTKVKKDDLARYYVLDAASKPVTDGPGAMKTTINELVGKATVQLSRLNDTRDTLKQTQENLAQTEQKRKEFEDLSVTQKKTIGDQEGKIGSLNQEVTQKTEQISQLDEAKANLEGTVKDQKDEIVGLKEKTQDLQDKLEQDKQLIADLNRRMGSNTNALAMAVPPGLKGQVVFINTNWNFVVLATTEQSMLAATVDLHVQRADKLVAKVRVSDVKPEYRLAIADILPDWQQVPIEVGDYVFY